MTDSQGVVVTNRWGDCETSALSSCQEEQISLPSCTTQSGPYPSQPCVFPFRYNGVTYTSSTTQAGTHIPGYFGYCPSSCPGTEGSSCTPGTSYTVDCNTCVCGADGNPVCTSNDCGSTTSTSTTTTSTTTTTSSTTSPATTTTTTSSPSSTCTTVSGPAAGADCIFP